MYAGRKVEEGPVEEIFARPLHPYTRGLLGSVPKLGSSLVDGGRGKLAEIPGLVPSLRQKIVGCAIRRPLPDGDRTVQPGRRRRSRRRRPITWSPATMPNARMAAAIEPHERPLLEVNGLKKHFPIHGGVLGLETAKVYAVDGVSFSINRGETLSLVGEVGLRQVHRRQGDPAALSDHRRRGVSGRRAHRQPARGQAAPAAPARAGGVPGSVLVAQSAHEGARHPGRAADQFRHRARRPRS